MRFWAAEHEGVRWRIETADDQTPRDVPTNGVDPALFMETPRRLEPHEDWDAQAGCIVVNAGRVGAMFLIRVDAERLRRLAAVDPRPEALRLVDEELAREARQHPDDPAPALAALAAAKGTSVDAERAAVLAAAEAAQAKRRRINAAALAAKAAIRAAESAEAKQAAFDTIQWPEET